jgi:hypothetical protein
MEHLPAATLPAGFSFEWTGTAFQETAAAGQTGHRARPAVLFAYAKGPQFEPLPRVRQGWTIAYPHARSSLAIFRATTFASCPTPILDYIGPDGAGGFTNLTRHGFLTPSLTKVTGERTLKPSLSASGSSIGNAAMKRGDEGVKPLAKDKVEATKSERLQTAPISNA